MATRDINDLVEAVLNKMHARLGAGGNVIVEPNAAIGLALVEMLGVIAVQLDCMEDDIRKQIDKDSEYLGRLMEGR